MLVAQQFSIQLVYERVMWLCSVGAMSQRVCRDVRGGGTLLGPSHLLVPLSFLLDSLARRKQAKKKNLTEVKNKMASENILKGGEGREKQKEKGGDSQYVKTKKKRGEIVPTNQERGRDQDFPQIKKKKRTYTTHLNI